METRIVNTTALVKVNSAQLTLRRLPAPQTTEDLSVTLIKDAINWVRKNPKTTMAIGATIVVAGLLFAWSDSDNN